MGKVNDLTFMVGELYVVNRQLTHALQAAEARIEEQDGEIQALRSELVTRDSEKGDRDDEESRTD